MPEAIEENLCTGLTFFMHRPLRRTLEQQNSYELLAANFEPASFEV